MTRGKKFVVAILTLMGETFTMGLKQTRPRAKQTGWIGLAAVTWEA
jgi:hypothetical protein